jgi:hypothetical protein
VHDVKLSQVLQQYVLDVDLVRVRAGVRVGVRAGVRVGVRVGG